MAEDRPSPTNVLLIVADQLSAQCLPTYGHRVVKSPHIDALGRQGVVFERAYCNVPLSGPSTMSLLAGQLPSRIEAFDNGSEVSAQSGRKGGRAREEGGRAGARVKREGGRARARVKRAGGNERERTRGAGGNGSGRERTQELEHAGLGMPARA